jgi:hypothetical protein
MSLSKLFKLENLCLKGCEVQNIEYPPCLRVLGLEDCAISNLPHNLVRINLRTCPNIKSFSTLDTVEIASLSCPSVESSEYLHLKQIKYLRVRGSITNTELAGLPHLVRLDARHTQITKAPFPIKEFIID